MSEGRVRGRGRTPSRGFWRPYEAPAALYGLTESFPSAKKSPWQTDRRRAAPRDKPPRGLKKQKIGPQRQNVRSGTPWKIWVL